MVLFKSCVEAFPRGSETIPQGSEIFHGFHGRLAFPPSCTALFTNRRSPQFFLCLQNDHVCKFVNRFYKIIYFCSYTRFNKRIITLRMHFLPKKYSFKPYRKPRHVVYLPVSIHLVYI